MGIKDRLLLIINELGISGRAFSRECGFSESYFATINEGIGADKLNKILSKFPQLSAQWLLTGDGQMFLSDTPETTVNANGSAELREIIREQRNRIEELVEENTKLRIQVNDLKKDYGDTTRDQKNVG